MNHNAVDGLNIFHIETFLKIQSLFWKYINLTFDFERLAAFILIHISYGSTKGMNDNIYKENWKIIFHLGGIVSWFFRNVFCAITAPSQNIYVN